MPQCSPAAAVLANCRVCAPYPNTTHRPRFSQAAGCALHTRILHRSHTSTLQLPCGSLVGAENRYAFPHGLRCSSECYLRQARLSRRPVPQLAPRRVTYAQRHRTITHPSGAAKPLLSSNSHVSTSNAVESAGPYGRHVAKTCLLPTCSNALPKPRQVSYVLSPSWPCRE